MERPNTRLGQIKRHLARVPKAAVMLQLQVAQSQESVTLLGEWPAEEVVPELAEEISLLLEEHAETVRASITGQLVFVTEAGTRVGSQKILRQSPPSMDEGDPSGTMWSTPAQLTGESQQQAAQAQRHLEVMTKMIFGAMGMLCTQMKSANEHVLELCETLATRLSDSEERSRANSERAADAEDMVSELAAQVQSQDAEKANEASERLMKLLEPLVPVIVGRVLAPPAPPQVVAPEVRSAE